MVMAAVQMLGFALVLRVVLLTSNSCSATIREANSPFARGCFWPAPSAWFWVAGAPRA